MGHDADEAVQKNPQLRTLTRRQELVDEQLEESMNPATRHHRSWVDAGTVREIVRLRDLRGVSADQIEQQLGLAAGVVNRLGPGVRDL